VLISVYTRSRTTIFGMKQETGHTENTCINNKIFRPYMYEFRVETAFYNRLLKER